MISCQIKLNMLYIPTGMMENNVQKWDNIALLMGHLLSIFQENYSIVSLKTLSIKKAYQEEQQKRKRKDQDDDIESLPEKK